MERSTITIKRYIAYGDECGLLSLSMRSEAERIMLRHIAETWYRLAEDELTRVASLPTLH